MGEGREDGSAGSSQEPLQGLLWPEVDAEAMPGAGNAKRLGVVGSWPAADSELTAWLGCFMSAEVARLTSAESPCNQAGTTWQPAKMHMPEGIIISNVLSFWIQLSYVSIEHLEGGIPRSQISGSSP